MKNLLEIIGKRLTPGILILDEHQRVSYANKEALRVISGSGRSEKDSITGLLPREIYQLCERLRTSFGKEEEEISNCAIMEVCSGLCYSLRALPVTSQTKDTPTHIMVLMEKVAEKREVDIEAAGREYLLSKRECEVLRLLCNGETNKGICEKLFISEYTVKDHIKKIMQKMGVKSRTEIIASLI